MFLQLDFKKNTLFYYKYVSFFCWSTPISFSSSTEKDGQTNYIDRQDWFRNQRIIFLGNSLNMMFLDLIVSGLCLKESVTTSSGLKCIHGLWQPFLLLELTPFSFISSEFLQIQE